MVKKLDEMVDTFDHFGVDLWRAAQAWKLQLHAEMVKKGHAWYGDARAAVAIHLDPRGLAQAELVSRIGLSKQAVHQLLDSLEAEGIVRREVDPQNRRAKRVAYTEHGLRSVADANEIKARIEARYVQLLGERTFDTLRRALSVLSRAER